MERIYIVGGDARMEYAVQALEREGPSAARITLEKAWEHAACGSMMVGGGLPPTLGAYDYLGDEVFLYGNARLTAEGALVLLGNSTAGQLFGADIAVIGMGRIAECLCPLLRAVGARVTVYARRAEVLARARAMGARTVQFTERLPASAVQHEMLCNTVPHLLLDAQLLEDARGDILLLELASAPGGFDPDAVAERGLQYVNGQGLPGKYAPRAAGELIAEYVLRVMKGEIIHE